MNGAHFMSEKPGSFQRSVLIQIGIALLALGASLVSWLAILLLLRVTGVEILQTLAVYVSHLSILGWILALAMAIAFYWLFARSIRKRV
jgi:hypothetical protein